MKGENCLFALTILVVFSALRCLKIWRSNLYSLNYGVTCISFVCLLTRMGLCFWYDFRHICFLLFSQVLILCISYTFQYWHYLPLFWYILPLFSIHVWYEYLYDISFLILLLFWYIIFIISINWINNINLD